MQQIIGLQRSVALGKLSWAKLEATYYVSILQVNRQGVHTLTHPLITARLAPFVCLQSPRWTRNWLNFSCNVHKWCALVERRNFSTVHQGSPIYSKYIVTMKEVSHSSHYFNSTLRECSGIVENLSYHFVSCNQLQTSSILFSIVRRLTFIYFFCISLTSLKKKVEQMVAKKLYSGSD